MKSYTDWKEKHFVLITFDLHISKVYEDKQDELHETVYEYFKNSLEHLPCDKDFKDKTLSGYLAGKKDNLTETTIISKIKVANMASAQEKVQENIETLFKAVKEDTKIDFTYNFVFAISEIEPTVV